DGGPMRHEHGAGSGEGGCDVSAQYDFHVDDLARCSKYLAAIKKADVVIMVALDRDGEEFIVHGRENVGTVLSMQQAGLGLQGLRMVRVGVDSPDQGLLLRCLVAALRGTKEQRDQMREELRRLERDDSSQEGGSQ